MHSDATALLGCAVATSQNAQNGTFLRGLVDGGGDRCRPNTKSDLFWESLTREIVNVDIKPVH